MKNTLVTQEFRNSFEPLHNDLFQQSLDVVVKNYPEFECTSLEKIYDIFWELSVSDIEIFVQLLPTGLYYLGISELPLSESLVHGIRLAGASMRRNEDSISNSVQKLLFSRWFIMDKMLVQLIRSIALEDVDGSVCEGLSIIRSVFFKHWPEGYANFQY